MARIHFGMLAVAMLIVSCGPGKGGTSSGPAKIAGDPIVMPGDTEPYEAPAHRFSPRSSAPRYRNGAATAPDSSRLPAMVEHIRQCYGSYENDDQLLAGSAPTSPSVIAAPSGGSPRKADSKKKESRSKAPLGGSGQGASSAKSAPAPSSAPAADMSAAPMEMAQSSEGSADYASSEEASAKIATDDAKDEEPPLSDYENWGAAIYLSNDDSMSLSSAQRVLYAIDNFLPLPIEHIRPHELLNYFSFETATVENGRDFSVLPDISPDPKKAGGFTLSLSVAGRPVTRATRPNTVLTWVIDRSGSMSSEGRMEYLKRGLKRSLAELKEGDMVHMVLFDHELCTPIENFVVGRDNMRTLESAIDQLAPMGSTDLHKGLSRGYEIADATYQADYSNRVVLITDALANTGVTDETMIAMISKYYDSRRIRLSGVGVGREFNDALLDKLTERGRGAYVFLGSEAEVDAVFGPRFISLIETTALDVHFQLHMPPSLRMNVFYGEESSTVKEDVQSIHYFANTSQLFLSDLIARGGQLRQQDDIMFTVEYEDPQTGEELIQEEAFSLGDIAAENSFNVRKASLAMAWVDLLTVLASRQSPSVYQYEEGGYDDPDGWQICDDGKKRIKQMSEGLENDPESRRIAQLFDKYCSRFERPRNPVKRQVVGPGDSWPGARPEEER